MNLTHLPMSGRMEETLFKNHQIFLYLPPSWTPENSTQFPAILVQDGDQAVKFLPSIIEEFETLWKNGKGQEVILAMIFPINRLSEYTPWPSRAMDSRFPDFEGKGNEYLVYLEKELLPWLGENYNADLNDISLLGYSLGGLINIYSLTIQNCWNHVAGICSSFWYDGWITYLKNSKSVAHKGSVYLHYGISEGKGKSGPMENAPLFARETGQLLKDFQCDVTITSDSGGHHSHTKKRYLEGLSWLHEQISAANK